MGNDDLGHIAHILDGDHEAFRALVDRYKDNVYRHCFYITRDEDVAEDMTQETFIRAFRHLRRYDAQKGSFKTWLYTIATRVCLEHLRKVKPLPLEDEDIVVSQNAATDQLAKDNEVHDAVLRLKPQYRTVVALHYWHGYSYEEIAQCMDVPIGSVRGWLYRAKKQLKEALS
jgi:RNA polymerase sigma-70 factor (ECF subfamily)